MPWDKEAANAARLKGLEVRRRRAQMSPAERVRDLAAADADAAMRDLIKAAKGQEPFDGLSLDKRLDALKTVLAYGVGRPTTTKAAQAEPDDDDGPEETPSLV